MSHTTKRISAWISEHGGTKEQYSHAEVMMLLESLLENLDLEAKKWQRVAATRLATILKKSGDDREAEDFPWGTLEDARHMRVVLIEEIASIERQLLDPRSRARSDEWRTVAASARQSKQGELAKLGDWITDEERRLLRDEVVDAVRESRD